MDDFQVILDELDKMEADAKARERERARARRWRTVRQRRKKRQRKQLALLSLLFCGLLAVPLSSAISAHFRDFHAPRAEQLIASVSGLLDEPLDSGETLVGDQAVKPADVDDLMSASGADVDDFMTASGADTETYSYENPENMLPKGYGNTASTSAKDTENPENQLPKGYGNTASTPVKGVENPENLLPGQTQPTVSTPSQSTSTSASRAVDDLTENPENLLPGETEAYAKTAQKFTPTRGAKTITLGQSAEIGSQYAVLIDADTGYIYAERNSDVKVPPASMTKVLTLLVATEKLIKVTPEGVKGMDTKVTVTKPVTDYCYANNCSIAGFARWETVTVRDLLYGCILPSGADACLALARHISGSQEEFVKLMNQKLEQLGISKTAHFTNCIGLYNAEHYCTMRDMAVIMKAAMSHSICRVILNARTFRTSSTAEHPKGISLSNLFLRRIEDRFTGTTLDIRGAKTGYVRQSGNCAVSFAAREDGKTFICVTGKGAGQWRVISDHTLLYRAYCLN